MNNDQWLTERAREVRASIETIRGIRDELGYLQIGWRPPDGGWSIAQIFEHLIISDSLYLPTFRELIAKGARGGAPWHPSMMGGFIARAVAPTTPRKTPSPGVFRPAEPRANVIDEYIKVREETARLMDAAHGLDLRRNRLSSPAAGLIRMNIGDAFMILVVHTQRHLQQIERVRDLPDFPAKT
jgi:hypothetical protein